MTTTTTYHIADIRNIALAGHGASAKTSLTDALLFAAGAVDRPGSVDDGTSPTENEDEERRRHFTIDCHPSHCEWSGRQLHLLDTPGYPDFVGHAMEALAAAENVVLAVSATAGVEAQTRWIEREATRLHLGGLIAVTKLDADNADFNRTLDAIRSAFGPRCVPFLVPIGEGKTFRGVIDVLDPPDICPDDCPLAPSDAFQMVVEQIVETDDELMTLYLDGEPIEPSRLREAAHRAVVAGTLVPVAAVSARRDVGVRELLDLLAEIGLRPDEVHRPAHPDGGDDTVSLRPIEDGELVAQVFKTTNDLFVGKLSVLRIHSGKITHDTPLLNLRTGKTSRPGHLFRLQGKAQEEVREAIAGDIIAVPKCDDLRISDTVTTVTNHNGTPRLALDPIRFPTPMVPRAVDGKARDDETRIAAGLARIADEDGTFSVHRDEQTHELVIAGMSELHLDVIRQRLRNRYKVEIDTYIPQVAYRETIGGEAEAHHRHKKQTGGRGQFADVRLRVRPRARGEGFRFVDAVKGGVIPGQFLPAIEKGVREQIERGVVSGNPVVDVEVEVFFGSHHPVDSSEAAFKTAGAAAFRKAVAAARPILLEPVVALEVTAPTDTFGDLAADLATRRGHITGLDTAGDDSQVIRATAPLAEVLRYGTDLKGLTGGRGSFSLEPRGLEPVPAAVQQEIVDRWARSRAGGDDD